MSTRKRSILAMMALTIVASLPVQAAFAADDIPGLPADLRVPGAFDIPDGLKVAFVADVVEGVQIYECRSSDSETAPDTVQFREPNAVLKARGRSGPYLTHTGFESSRDAAGRRTILPQWRTTGDGTQVSGRALQTADRGARNIPDLLVQVAGHDGSDGRLSDVTHLLRLNSTGGVSPAPVGSTCNLADRNPIESRYTATYVFLRPGG